MPCVIVVVTMTDLVIQDQMLDSQVHETESILALAFVFSRASRAASRLIHGFQPSALSTVVLTAFLRLCRRHILSQRCRETVGFEVGQGSLHRLYQEE